MLVNILFLQGGSLLKNMMLQKWGWLLEGLKNYLAPNVMLQQLQKLAYGWHSKLLVVMVEKKDHWILQVHFFNLMTFSEKFTSSHQRHMNCGNTGTVCLLKNTWWFGWMCKDMILHLKKQLIELGCKMSKIDKSVFMYSLNGNKLQWIVVTHVDHFSYCGGTTFKNNVMQSIHNKIMHSRLAECRLVYLHTWCGKFFKTKIILLLTKMTMQS